jgi:hypothetical protein
MGSFDIDDISLVSAQALQFLVTKRIHITCDNCQDCQHEFEDWIRRFRWFATNPLSSLSIIKKCVESGYKQPATKEELDIMIELQSKGIKQKS